MIEQINDLAYSEEEVKEEIGMNEEMYENYRTDTVNVIQGNLSAGDNQNEIRKFEVYQNQRIWMGMFKDAVFPHERPVWSDETGSLKTPKESILLPAEGGWKW